MKITTRQRLTDWNKEHVSRLEKTLGTVNGHSKFATDDGEHLYSNHTWTTSSARSGKHMFHSSRSVLHYL